MKKRKILYIIAGLIIIVASISLAYGRYIYNEIKDAYLATKSFYFNSDKLTTSRAIYQVENWSAVDPYSITINLNNRKNNLIHASSDITYEVTYVCSDNVLCSINTTGGVLLAEEVTDTFNAVVTPNSTFKEGDEAFIEIYVKSTSPYKKSLSGRFIFKIGKSGVSYKIDDKQGRTYLNFNITNTIDYYLVKTAFETYSVNDRIDRNTYINLSEENKKNCVSAKVKMTFDPNVVIFDMTNTIYLKKETFTTTNINGYDYINSITFNMDSESSEFIKFYKADTSKDYTYPITNQTSIINFDIIE